jgi:hypothetical protein
MRCIFFVVALALSLTPASAKDELANVKSVAIISAIGDCFRLQRVDSSPFAMVSEDPECALIDGIDEAVSDQITSALAPRFAVKTVRYDRNAFSRMPFLLATGSGEADIEKPLEALTNPGVDAYVVVQKLRLGNVVSDVDVQSDGIGIAHESSVFGATNKMFALFTIRIVDARTFKTLADHPVKKPGSFLGLFPIYDTDTWARWAREMTPEQKAAAKAQMMDILRNCIADSLKKMELTQ